MNTESEYFRSSPEAQELNQETLVETAEKITETTTSTQAESLVDREHFDIDSTLSTLSQEDESKLCEILGLSEDTTPEQLHSKVEEHLEKYHQKVEECNQFLTEQIPIIKDYVAERGLTPHQNPEDIPVYITDPAINILTNTEFTFAAHYKGEYLPDKGVVKTSEKDIIPHELFHAMSHDKANETLGFAILERDEEGNPVGNTWLDEGIVMLGEYSVYPDERRTFHEEDYSMYTQGYLFLTELLKNELKLSTIDLQKAHFKQEPEYSQLTQKVQERFNCTIPELSCIFIGYDEDTQRDITMLMKGLPVTRTYIKGSGADKSLRKLQKIFPTLTIEAINPPIFED